MEDKAKAAAEKFKELHEKLAILNVGTTMMALQLRAYAETLAKVSIATMEYAKALEELDKSMQEAN
jgi:hypothetical protein